jgi:hypothetical protein
MIMKKIIFASIVLINLLLLTSCPGPNGSAYQKYWWAGSLGYIYDTNPSTPNTIYNDVYFPTNSGSYYMEYQAFDGSEWYMYYTITTKSGAMFNTSGDDSWFEIGLYYTGPVLYEWDSARKIMNDDESKKVLSHSVSTINTKDKISTGKVLSKILGSDEKENINGSIRIEYGRLLDE